MTANRTTVTKRSSQFRNFQDRLDDFTWLVEWGALGLPCHHLYCIGPEGGRPVKTGVSAKVGKRLRQLQTGNWAPLHVLRSAWVDCEADARRLEAAIHRDMSDSQMAGEWFDATAHMAFELALSKARELGIDVRSTIPTGYRDVVFDLVRKEMKDETARAGEVKAVRADKLRAVGISKMVIDSLN